jgi:hypothetical protein
MSETRIKIKELEMNGETAIRIAECLKKHEPEIWKTLSGELKQALRIDDVVESVCVHVRGSIIITKGEVCAECRNCGELY